MNSRKRVELALNHEEPDRVPLDLAGTEDTGMHVSSVYKLRQALGLDEPGTPVKVSCPYTMKGKVEPDLINALGVDIVSLSGKENIFGFKNEGWKPWKTFDGTPVLVPEKFNTEPDENGDIYMYPQGDKSVPPCAKMPKGGYYFDSIMRQEPIDDDNLNPEDNLEEFNPISQAKLDYLEKEANRLYTETDKAIFFDFGGTSFGDAALIPGPGLKNPKGIRDLKEWYMSQVSRQDYIYEVFKRQCEIGLDNLEKIYKVVGNKVSAVFVSATDFGMQNGLMVSPEVYRKLYKPFHKKVNNWVHNNTEWKTFIHSCGSVWDLLDDFVEAGFDLLNPIQTSAARMDPEKIKNRYGSDFVLWGGGIDTQKTLPFGEPSEIKEQVKKRIDIFAPNGGFVFTTIHNVQPKTPIENILVMYKTFKENAYY